MPICPQKIKFRALSKMFFLRSQQAGSMPKEFPELIKIAENDGFKHPNKKAINFYLKHEFDFSGIFLDKYGEGENALLMMKRLV